MSLATVQNEDENNDVKTMIRIGFGFHVGVNKFWIFCYTFCYIFIQSFYVLFGKYESN